MSANKIFKRTVFEIDVYGEQIKVRKPTGLEKQKYISAIDELNNPVEGEEKKEHITDYDLTVKFLETLGMPENVFFEMEDEHQLELILMLVSEKKS